MSIRKALSAWLVTLAFLNAGVASSSAQVRIVDVDRADSSGKLLDVPYVPQSEALCGGAAVAMVLRYWGSPPVYAEDFSPFVTEDESVAGIRLADLARAVEGRGWRAVPFAGTPSAIQEHLARGRPVITLVEDRPGRYHYVVVVSWVGERIVFHDPAGAPFRVMDRQTFERVWDATGRTSLLILPPAEAAALGEVDRARENVAPARPVAAGCARPVDEAVRLARAGDLDAAETLLTLAGQTCRSSSEPIRELAGIRFLQKRWADAAALAEDATRRDPSDQHAWQLLASARFLDTDRDGALAAWNQRNEPRVDLVRVDGLGRIRHQVVADLLRLPPRTLLTARQLSRARRRLADLPALQMSRVGYVPRANGIATIDVAVVERPLRPQGWSGLGAAGVRAVASREARLDLASPTGNGELWTFAWRWWAGRPRVALSLATSRVGPWTGRWMVSGAWERQAYQYQSADGTAFPRDSERRNMSLMFGDWATGRVRWEVGVGLDQWNQAGRQISAGGSLEQRVFDDRAALRVGGMFWPRIGASAGFGSGSAAAAWRSGAEGRASWTILSGVQIASVRAPLDLWPAADTGHARAPLLRAHPLLKNGIIPVEALGRALAHTTVEFQKPLPVGPLARLRWAAFVDVVKQGRMAAAAAPLQIDLGAGLRAGMPGGQGLVRLDVARGVRDGHIAVSAAWQPSWPGW